MKHATWAQARMVVPGLPRLRAAHGFAYFASGSDGFVKIGHSKSPQRRVVIMNGDATRAAFQERHGFDPGRATIDFLVEGCGPVHERALQCAFEAEYVGGEWFRGAMVSAAVSQLLELAVDAVPVAHNEGQRLLGAQLMRYGATAELARATGISGSRLSRYTNGHQNPDTGARVALEQALGIPIMSWDQSTRLH